MVIKESKIKLTIVQKCLCLHVNRSSFYKWVNNKTLKNLDENKFYELISDIFHKSKGTYGKIRITLALKNMGFVINHKKVYRIMKKLNLKAKIRKKWKTNKNKNEHMYENILNQNFTTNTPNNKLVCDITELKRINGERFYLFVVEDLYNNEIIDFNISRRY